MSDEGALLFESHFPSYESSERLNEVLKVLERYFNIEEAFKLTMKLQEIVAEHLRFVPKKSVRID